jgi:hypothetical protein
MIVAKKLSIIAILLSFIFCLGFDLDLAPHEEKLVEAFTKVSINADRIKSLHAEDSFFELACRKDQVVSGTFASVLGKVLPQIKFVAQRIEPITSTNDKNPDQGVFSYKWIAFMRTKDDCHAIFSGFGFAKVSHHVA